MEAALSILTRSLDQDANLHSMGRYLMRGHLLQLLKTRLRLIEYWRSRSTDLSAAAITRPIFITGVPRSGSTFLHELLAQDAESRTPRVWEVMFPLPSAGSGRDDSRRRVRQTETRLWLFRRLARDADSVFPIRARSPHECIAIHSYTFLSDEFVSTCRVRSYEAFLCATDRTPAYRWEKRFLQHLQLSRPTARWLLKSPDHASNLRELFAVFPDAVIILTHRSPLDVVASNTRLTSVLQRLYAYPGDFHAIARNEARLLSDQTERILRFRDAHPELADRFIDVRYSDFVSNPVGTVEDIYNRLKIELSDSVRNRVRELSARHSRYRPSQRSSPGNLEFAIQEHLGKFYDYCRRFGEKLHAT